MAIEQEDADGDEDADEIELVVQAVQIHQQLFGVSADEVGCLFKEGYPNAFGRADFFVLTASECVDETLDRARITPLHRRVTHASNRHVKIERHADHERAASPDGGESVVGATLFTDEHRIVSRVKPDSDKHH